MCGVQDTAEWQMGWCYRGGGEKKRWRWGTTVTNFFKYIKQGCTNPRCEVAWVTKCCTMAANYCDFFPSLKQKAPDNSEVHGSLQNCGSSGWNLPRFTIMAPRIWRWLLKVRKICVSLYQKHENNTLTADYILDMRYIYIWSHSEST